MQRILKVRRQGGVPECEIVVGHAHFGHYQVGRYPPGGRPILVKSGDTADLIPDIFPLGVSVAELDKNRLAWGVLVVSYLGAKDPYSVTVIIRQDGQELDRDVRHGNLANGMAEVGEWLIQLV